MTSADIEEQFGRFMLGNSVEIWKTGLYEFGIDTRDLYDGLLEKEKQRHMLNMQARYMKHRQTIVDWIIDVCETERLTAVTTHTAVALLDLLLNSADFQNSQLQLCAICCILIASKFEEQEDRIPPMHDLCHLSQNAYSIDQIKEMEVVVLRFLGWNVRRAMHPLPFLGYLLSRGCIVPTDRVEGRPVTSRIAKYVTKYSEFFVDQTLTSDKYMQFQPSVVAAAAMACARHTLRIHPVWSQQLHDLAGVDLTDLTKCTEIMFADFERMYPSNNRSPNSLREGSPRSVQDGRFVEPTPPPIGSNMPPQNQNQSQAQAQMSQQQQMEAMRASNGRPPLQPRATSAPMGRNDTQQSHNQYHTNQSHSSTHTHTTYDHNNHTTHTHNYSHTHTTHSCPSCPSRESGSCEPCPIAQIESQMMELDPSIGSHEDDGQENENMKHNNIHYMANPWDNHYEDVSVSSSHTSINSHSQYQHHGYISEREIC